MDGISPTIQRLSCVDAATGAFVMGAWYPGGEGGCGNFGGVWRVDGARVTPYFQPARSSEIMSTPMVDLTGDGIPEVVVFRNPPYGESHVVLRWNGDTFEAAPSP